MSNEARIELMQSKLEKALSPSHIQIIDDSHQHIGHAGAKDGKGHFTLHIASPFFDNKPPIQCHKMIYQALGDLMQTDIHALSIKII